MGTNPLRDEIYGNGTTETMRLAYLIERDHLLKAKESRDTRLYQYHGQRMSILHECYCKLMDHDDSHALVI